MLQPSSPTMHQQQRRKEGESQAGEEPSLFFSAFPSPQTSRWTLEGLSACLEITAPGVETQAGSHRKRSHKVAHHMLGQKTSKANRSRLALPVGLLVPFPPVRQGAAATLEGACHGSCIGSFLCCVISNQISRRSCTGPGLVLQRGDVRQKRRGQ